MSKRYRGRSPKRKYLEEAVYSRVTNPFASAKFHARAKAARDLYYGTPVYNEEDVNREAHKGTPRRDS